MLFEMFSKKFGYLIFNSNRFELKFDLKLNKIHELLLKKSNKISEM